MPDFSGLKVLLKLWFLPALTLFWLKGQDQLLIQRLTVDPAALMGIPPYYGLLSNIGVTLWLSTASVLLYVAWSQAHVRHVLLLPGILSLVLGLDDGLMIHEQLLPQFSGIYSNVGQPLLYVFYAAMLGLSLRNLRPWFREPAFIVLLAAAACFGSSVIIDMLVESQLLPQRHPLMINAGLEMWLEDGLKFLGIVAWWGYWVGFSARLQKIVTADL